MTDPFVIMVIGAGISALGGWLFVWTRVRAFDKRFGRGPR